MFFWNVILGFDFVLIFECFFSLFDVALVFAEFL